MIAARLQRQLATAIATGVSWPICVTSVYHTRQFNPQIAAAAKVVAEAFDTRVCIFAEFVKTVA